MRMKYDISIILLILAFISCNLPTDNTSNVTSTETEAVPTVLVMSITVSGESNLSEITDNDGTLQLFANILPANSTNKTVTWSVISQTGTAIISTDGILKAVTNGTVIVKAAALDGSNVYGTKVISISGQVIDKPVTEILLESYNNLTAITVPNGTLDFTASIIPADSEAQSVTWAISPEGIASITSTGNLTARLTALANGTVTVSAYDTDKQTPLVSDSINIVISGQPDPGTIKLKVNLTSSASIDESHKVFIEVTKDKFLQDKNQVVYQLDLSSDATSDISLPAGTYYISGVFDKDGDMNLTNSADAGDLVGLVSDYADSALVYDEGQSIIVTSGNSTNAILNLNDKYSYPTNAGIIRVALSYNGIGEVNQDHLLNFILSKDDRMLNDGLIVGSLRSLHKSTAIYCTVQGNISYYIAGFYDADSSQGILPSINDPVELYLDKNIGYSGTPVSAAPGSINFYNLTIDNTFIYLGMGTLNISFDSADNIIGTGNPKKKVYYTITTDPTFMDSNKLVYSGEHAQELTSFNQFLPVGDYYLKAYIDNDSNGLDESDDYSYYSTGTDSGTTKLMWITGGLIDLSTDSGILNITVYFDRTLNNKYPANAGFLEVNVNYNGLLGPVSSSVPIISQLSTEASMTLTTSPIPLIGSIKSISNNFRYISILDASKQYYINGFLDLNNDGSATVGDPVEIYDNKIYGSDPGTAVSILSNQTFYLSFGFDDTNLFQ